MSPHHTPPDTKTGDCVRTWENVMPFIPATWIVEAVMQYTMGGQEVRNVFHVDPHESPSTILLTSIADAFALWGQTELMPIRGNDLTLYNVQTKDLTTVTGAVANSPFTSPVPGGSAGGSDPNNVATCVSFKTLLSGRSYQGRSYLPGVPLSAVTGSSISSGHAASVLAAFMSLISDINAAGWDLVVTSYFGGGLPRTSAVSTIITDVLVNLVLDSQRRRLPGRGE